MMKSKKELFSVFRERLKEDYAEKPKRLCEPSFSGTFLQCFLSSKWNDEQWKNEIQSMRSDGIDTLILQDIANRSSVFFGGEWKVYYNSGLACFSNAEKHTDVIENALKNCEGSGIKVFIGLTMFDDFWLQGGFTGQYQRVCRIGADMVREIYAKYKSRYPDSFGGWYFTPEINNIFLCEVGTKAICRGLNTVIEAVNETQRDLPIILSPFYSDYFSFGTFDAFWHWVTFFQNARLRDGDIIAPQDALGAGWVKENSLQKNWIMYLCALKASSARLRLWANCENFVLNIPKQFANGIIMRPVTENKDIVTAPLSRFIRQMDIASRYCEKIITFSYNHFFSPSVEYSSSMTAYHDYLNNGFRLEPQRVENDMDFSAEQLFNKVRLTWKKPKSKYDILYYRLCKNGKLLTRIECSVCEPVYRYDDLGESFANRSYSITAVDVAGNSSQEIFVKIKR